ncbi:hypothetical protein AMTR_s00021p00039780 [Amborella trichopoda]|uniref:Uncharacterized protein n=1 Tax=Amborella trichopoda TaxID=13333 RepID=W1Q0Y3_AMBTC|nr:hypothetical protein AMTR_s00021p00039780 [Amborella trichopoda]
MNGLKRRDGDGERDGLGRRGWEKENNLGVIRKEGGRVSEAGVLAMSVGDAKDEDCWSSITRRDWEGVRGREKQPFLGHEGIRLPIEKAEDWLRGTWPQGLAGARGPMEADVGTQGETHD